MSVAVSLSPLLPTSIEDVEKGSDRDGRTPSDKALAEVQGFSEIFDAMASLQAQASDGNFVDINAGPKIDDSLVGSSDTQATNLGAMLSQYALGSSVPKAVTSTVPSTEKTVSVALPQKLTTKFDSESIDSTNAKNVELPLKDEFVGVRPSSLHESVGAKAHSMGDTKFPAISTLDLQEADSKARLGGIDSGPSQELKPAEKFLVAPAPAPAHLAAGQGGEVASMPLKHGNPTYVFDTPTVPNMGNMEGNSHSQVAYWIGSEVHNAEMKLQGPGSEMLDVSINLTGKEADVVFRSDELLTRNLLESSSGQLKDLLSQQGVTLMGVSVGTSGEGKTGNKDHKPRNEFSKRGDGVKQVVSVSRSPVNTGSVGGALDLFV